MKYFEDTKTTVLKMSGYIEIKTKNKEIEITRQPSKDEYPMNVIVLKKDDILSTHIKNNHPDIAKIEIKTTYGIKVFTFWKENENGYYNQKGAKELTKVLKEWI